MKTKKETKPPKNPNKTQANKQKTPPKNPPRNQAKTPTTPNKQQSTRKLVRVSWSMKIKRLLLLDDAKMSHHHVAQRKIIRVANKCAFRVITTGNQCVLLGSLRRIDVLIVGWHGKQNAIAFITVFLFTPFCWFSQEEAKHYFWVLATAGNFIKHRLLRFTFWFFFNCLFDVKVHSLRNL